MSNKYENIVSLENRYNILQIKKRIFIFDNTYLI
jgi:hypothetical protein